MADNWYPLKPRQVDYLGGFEEKDTTFALARLVDADVDILPTPKGDILRAYVPETESEDVPTIHDEELTRAGAEVTRSYQLARWRNAYVVRPAVTIRVRAGRQRSALRLSRIPQ